MDGGEGRGMNKPSGALLVEDTGTALLAADGSALFEGDADGAVAAAVDHCARAGGDVVALGEGARGGFVVLAGHFFFLVDDGE